jgi:hypothetical protein
MRLLALILALVIFTAPAAHADERVELVIGNAAYRNVTPRVTPRNDADDIAASLSRLNFSVNKVIDGTRCCNSVARPSGLSKAKTAEEPRTVIDGCFQFTYRNAYLCNMPNTQFSISVVERRPWSNTEAAVHVGKSVLN